MSPSRLTYRFGPLERRGLIGALRSGQVVVLAAGLVGSVLLLDGAPSASGALGAIMLLGGACTAALVPLGRRGLDEWIPVGVSYLLRRLSRRRTFRSGAPASGARTEIGIGSRGLTPGEPAPHSPPSLKGLRITALTYRDREVGVLWERSGKRLSAVLACRVGAFALLDPEAQERRLARWGLVLSGAASSPIRRLGWVERTAPAQGDELARWLHAERDPAVPLRGTAMVESYLELIATTARVTQEHEIMVVVQVDGARVRDRGPDAVEDALLGETERVAQSLEAAEVSVLGALGPGQLSRTLRSAFDPYVGAELATMDAAERQRKGLTEVNAWPLGAEESWDHLRSDGALHATFWIAGWPRVDVSPMFMDALLGRSSAVRAIAVTFEALPPDRSTREVEAAVTRDQADREIRRRLGQSETARQRQSQEATARREAELAAGHCEVRLTGFVTVSGRDPEELRRATAEVLEHAARARLELHRMYGQQAEAFTFTLPLCRGLR